MHHRYLVIGLVSLDILTTNDSVVEIARKWLHNGVGTQSRNDSISWCHFI